MKRYKNIGGGRKRSFAVTVGLQEGYDKNAITHTAAEVVQSVLDWMKSKAGAGLPYLTGTIVSGEVVYAYPDGPGVAGGGHESVATFQGEVSPLYNAETTDEQTIEILDDLAAYLGNVTGQTRVYVAYRDEIHVLQAEKTATPTGETV